MLITTSLSLLSFFFCLDKKLSVVFELAEFGGIRWPPATGGAAGAQEKTYLPKSALTSRKEKRNFSLSGRFIPFICHCVRTRPFIGATLRVFHRHTTFLHAGRRLGIQTHRSSVSASDSH